MYMNKTKYNSTLIWSLVGLFAGGFPSIFWFSILMAMLITGDLEVPVLVISLFFFVLSVVFIVLGIRGLMKIFAVNKCLQAFENDPDGFIQMDKILNGKKPGCGRERRILDAVEKGFFERVTYDRKYRMFELSDRIQNKNDYLNRFIGINCPNCGNTLKVKVGMTVFCNKCGQEVLG